MLPTVPEAAEVYAAYDVTIASLDSFIQATHLQWFDSVHTSVARELEHPLLTQDKTSGLLAVNFDP